MEMCVVHLLCVRIGCLESDFWMLGMLVDVGVN